MTDVTAVEADEPMEVRRTAKGSANIKPVNPPMARHGTPAARLSCGATPHGS